MSAAPDPALSALLGLLDLLQQESARLIEALERVAGELSALEEREAAAGAVLASVDSRLGILEP
jgi:hypothetical protein